MSSLRLLRCGAGLSILLLACALATSSRAGEELDADNFRPVLSRDLRAGRTVVLHFYAAEVPESRDPLPKLRKIVRRSGGKGALHAVNAGENPGISAAYGVRYAPTTFLIRPGEGIVRAFVIDLDYAQVKKLISGKSRRLPGVESIAGAIAARKPSLVFFMADWCSYCRVLIPEVDRFKSSFGGAVVVRSINVDKNQRLSDEYLVSGVPQIVLMDPSGVLLDRLSFPAGYDDYLEAFRSLGIKLGKSG
ncbi:MAG: thioredoxin family protein [bacterium]